MTRRKLPKKTESLEVRLPHAVKRAFMARARAQGRTASSLVREFIESYLAGTNPAMEKRAMLKRLAPPAALTSFAAAAIALHMPTAASAAPDLRRCSSDSTATATVGSAATSSPLTTAIRFTRPCVRSTWAA